MSGGYLTGVALVIFEVHPAISSGRVLEMIFDRHGGATGTGSASP